jgi:hypothetical protein
MTTFKQYDPTKVSVSIGTVLGRAFADGEMVTVEFSEDKRTKHIGTDGQGRHILNMDRSGTVTVRFASYSPTNAEIIALDLLDQPFPITVTDKSSTADLFFADSCTLTKVPNMVKGSEEAPNEYVFQFIRGEIVHSGAEV